MPAAVDLLRMCRCAAINVDAALSEFHPLDARPTTGDALLATWMDSLRGSRSIAKLSQDLGVSRFKLSRWLSGQVGPRLCDFLLFIEAVTGRTSELVGSLVPIEKVPALLADHRAAEAAKRLAHEAPWTEAVLRVLESGDYVPGGVAGQLGFDQATEDESIRRLLEAKIVARDASGRIHVTRDLNVDTHAAATLKAHWCDVARQRLEVPGHSDLFAYNVLSASHEDIALIRNLLLETYREIRAVVRNSSSVEAVALINLQLVTFPKPGIGKIL